jgi:hypothetical protein
MFLSTMLRNRWSLSLKFTTCSNVAGSEQGRNRRIAGPLSVMLTGLSDASEIISKPQFPALLRMITAAGLPLRQQGIEESESVVKTEPCVERNSR